MIRAPIRDRACAAATTRGKTEHALWLRRRAARSAAAAHRAGAGVSGGDATPRAVVSAIDRRRRNDALAVDARLPGRAHDALARAGNAATGCRLAVRPVVAERARALVRYAGPGACISGRRR